jgi:hypothetical protein
MARPKKIDTGTEEKPKMALTEAQQKIWDAIKDLDVEYFALPWQTISTICNPLNLVPDVLYVNLKSSAAIRSIELALNKKVVRVDKEMIPMFVVEQQNKYFLIKNNPDIL